MLAADLRKLPDAELREKAAEIRLRLFNLGFKSAVEAIKNSSEVTEARRDVARIQGILGERAGQGKARRDSSSRSARRARTALGQRLKADAARKAAVKAAASKAKAAKKGKAGTGSGSGTVTSGKKA